MAHFLFDGFGRQPGCVILDRRPSTATLHQSGKTGTRSRPKFKFYNRYQRFGEMVLEKITNIDSTSRAIAYHSTDYILRYMLDIGSIFEYEYEKMMIYMVIANSSIQNVVQTPERFAPYWSTSTIIPAEMQRPVTRSAIARATGLPRETVRRKVAAMLVSDLLITDPRGGLRLTPGILTHTRIADLLAKNEANVRRLVRQVSPLMCAPPVAARD